MLLLLLTVFGPISMDLYLPLLPALTAELGAATSTAQLTVTACLFGLALGQLVAGPLSDRFGRSAPLYAGVVAYIATSLVCAASPTVEALVAARLVQGVAGGAGIVIAQAAGRDLYSGGALIRYYGRVTVVGGLAAVVGPFLGGRLAAFTDWRGLFVFLAALGAVILLAIAVGHRETLPPKLRTTGGFARTCRDVRTLLSDRRYTGAVLVQGFVNAALFAYLSGATYVLQGTYGLSPQQYALAFGLNSAGFMLSGYVAGLSSERYGVTATLAVGLVMCAAGALGLLAGGIVALPLVAVVVSLLLVVSGVAVTTPPTTALALADHPRTAGTASALLGAARFAFGGFAAPLVGIAGAATMLPLGIVTVVSVALAAAACAALEPRRAARPSAAAPEAPEPQPVP
ncbi:multidrug effflux MFS transporter [Pseudonocardia kunmingensis]|uniref:DHA1 family bicyclomycin/chloramphenicol resistance-like MFS transporter n=1 Tax=Pseudonocardia kunmingensis TaxID=630975 RepID=A0A543DL24_9PSEU|nr:multidrug effflux MFS transporter [Pseudonocardia kunmingensis]TQM10001.1 DHA1 family bicyclomycin/chloramphenicol resistance-like MFS transporter [Pseudonocardia kunmingensis]